MNRPIRIGLIAEGEAELGTSIPYIKPEEDEALSPPTSGRGFGRSWFMVHGS